MVRPFGVEYQLLSVILSGLFRFRPGSSGSFTLKKLECLKQAFAVNTLAWNNNLGLRFYFVGF